MLIWKPGPVGCPKNKPPLRFCQLFYKGANNFCEGCTSWFQLIQLPPGISTEMKWGYLTLWYFWFKLLYKCSTPPGQQLCHHRIVRVFGFGSKQNGIIQRFMKCLLLNSPSVMVCPSSNCFNPVWMLWATWSGKEADCGSKGIRKALRTAFKAFSCCVFFGCMVIASISCCINNRQQCRTAKNKSNDKKLILIWGIVPHCSFWRTALPNRARHYFSTAVDSVASLSSLRSSLIG